MDLRKQRSTSDVYVDVQRSAQTLKKNSVQVSQYLIFRRRRLSRISVPKSQKSRQYLLKGELWWKFFQIKAPVKREKKERKKLRKKA